ncbi:hypothetical protein [Dyadobacter sp. CY312]|uniref:hypothetical protein n=1 Tax=Dyadobacter sp. CY312 TaxID=2907303 RepID=UPI001F17DB9F|nr:hypothetical protein [Dyadobacter sp. CY312]MCE7043935.1 hypothetical protein [Dyadobacter sp. CY312]
MKHRLLLLVLLLSTVGFAQKVDLDKFGFTVSYQKLPNEPVKFEERTYGIKPIIGNALRSYADEAKVYDAIWLSGWKKVELNPTVGIVLSLNDFVFTGMEIKSRIDEKKDKDGKVTSRTTYYWSEATYFGAGFCEYVGPVAPEVLTEKQLAKQKEKEQKVATNRFLEKANITHSQDEGIGKSKKRFDVSFTYVYKSPESTVSSGLSSDFRNNKDAIFSDNIRKFVADALMETNNTLNNVYGYRPVNDRETLWIINSKEHPEYQLQSEAIEAVKELFKTMKADEPIENLEKNLEPLIDYFQSLKTKYTSDDKRNKKIRYSAFYNLGYIFYYLDQPGKAIIEAKGLIANDYDTKDGEKLIERSEQLMKRMEKIQVYSTHNPPLN